MGETMSYGSAMHTATDRQNVQRQIGKMPGDRPTVHVVTRPESTHDRAGVTC